MAKGMTMGTKYGAKMNGGKMAGGKKKPGGKKITENKPSHMRNK